jgi:hypothetical protein
MSLFRTKGRFAQPGRHPLATGRRRLPQIAPYTRRRYGSGTTLAWSLLAAVLALMILVVAAPFWLPAVRWVVPDRYIMAYAPKPLQPIIFRIDVAEQVPTPSGAGEQGAAIDLLQTPLIPPTPTLPPPTQNPAVMGGGGGGYIQPTPVPVAPTPTVTPAYSPNVDPRAADRENAADLANIDALLTGFTFHQQTGTNNCGPASIATMMSYWSVNFTLEEARNFLKPNPSDPNVRPDEMVQLAESYGYNMIVRENGNFERLQQFVLAGYPVLIETGYDPEPQTIGWTSHFLTIVGYSEQDQGFIAMDTYRRPNWFYPYNELDYFWRQFNRRYMVAYRPDQAAAVASIIGEDMDDTTMWQNAAFVAQFELSLNRDDPYGWFNLGTSLAGLGRWQDAADAYDVARQLGLPWRFLWYQFGPFETYLQVKRYDDVFTLADAVLEKIPTEEPYYYKGLAYAAQGNASEARRQLEQAVRLNRNYLDAQVELDRLGSG